MSNLKNLFSGQPDTHDIPIRPLSKGMILNVSSQMVPFGAFLDLKNYQATTRGLVRRRNYSVFASGTFEGNPIDLVTLWSTAGTQKTFLITDTYLYSVSSIGGMSAIYWKETVGTVSISGTSITGSGTRWQDIGIKKGDVLVVGAETGIVSSVGSNTAITLESATITDASNQSYTIRRVFGAEDPYMIDWVIANDLLIIATVKNQPLYVDFSDTEMHPLIGTTQAITATVTSGSATLSAIDPAYANAEWVGQIMTGTGIAVGATIESIISLTSVLLSANATASGTSVALTIGTDHYPSTGIFSGEGAGFFDDSVWFSHCIDDTDGDRRQRIRWSSVTDITDFSISTNYLDLPYSEGRAKRIVPMGNQLVCYFDDAVYIGTLTSEPLLPVAFNQIPTGGIGLVGSRAVVQWLDGHFFVGQDDIYYLSNRGLQKIGTPVVKKTLNVCQSQWRIIASIDPQRHRVVFGFPEDSDYIAKVWSYDYIAQAWSYEVVEGIESYLLSNPLVNSSITWGDATIAWNDSSISTYVWSALVSAESFRSLYQNDGTNLIRQSDDNTASDYDTNAILTVVELPDLDYGNIDTIKTHLRLSMKITKVDEVYNEQIVFTVTGTANRGKSWKSLGTLTIETDKDEGYVNFRLSGSTGRIKLTSSSQCRSYEINEIGLRVVGSGIETGTYKQNV